MVLETAESLSIQREAPGKLSTVNRLMVTYGISFSPLPSRPPVGPSPVPGSAYATAQKGLECREAAPSQRTPSAKRASGPNIGWRRSFLPGFRRQLP